MLASKALQESEGEYATPTISTELVVNASGQ